MTFLKKLLVATLFAAAIPVVSSAASFPGSYRYSYTYGQPSQYQTSQYPSAPNSSAGGNASLNWSGYIATQGPFTSISGSWTVPTVASVSSTMADATWVGIGGVSSHSLIQAGTQALTDPSGSVTYQAWYELLPSDMQTVSLPVNAGDAISATITQTSPDIWEISLTDHTTGGSYETSVDYNADTSSAEWIEEMPTANIGILPLDEFGTVSFTGGSAVENGANVTIAQAGAQPITMVTNDSATLASPSALGSDGASFTVTRSHVVVSSVSDRTGYSGRNPFGRVGVGVGVHGRWHFNGGSGTTTGTGTITTSAPSGSITVRRITIPQAQLLQFLQTQFGIRLMQFNYRF